MRIRWKFFVVLFAFSLIPLGVVTMVSLGEINHIGTVLSESAMESLTNIVSRELVQTTQAAAASLGQTAVTLEFALHYLALETTAALENPPDQTARIFFPEDFRQNPTISDDLVPSNRYLQATEQGINRPVAVSFHHPVYLIAPGSAIRKDGPVLARLSKLGAVLREIYQKSDEIIHHIYVGFENGLHISYPGHGAYPPDFDPRKRPWYKKIHKEGELSWLAHVDASSNQVVFTMGIPILKSNNQIAGIAAVDILPAKLMQVNWLHPLWSKEIKSFLVTPVSEPETGRLALEILAKSDINKDDLLKPGGDRLSTDIAFTSAQMDKLIKAVAAGKSGHMELPYQNKDAIWAYATDKESTGEIYSFILVIPKTVVTAIPVQTQAVILALTNRNYLIVGITAAVVILLVTIVAFVGSRAITQPMIKVVDVWKKLAGGDFSVRLNLRSRDERDQVYQAFNEVVPKLEAHFHMSQAMELARQIQQNLLPRHFPTLAGIDVYGDSRYCDATGGDYYDIYETDSEGYTCLNVLVGDVCGHGVQAALLMTTVRALIRSLSYSTGSLAERITSVNRLLYPDTVESGSFVTLFCLEYEAETGKMRWVRAGHDPAIVYDSVRDTFEELKGNGMALGIEGTYIYEENLITGLNKEQIIVIGTDGIWEACNKDGEMFGRARLREIIRGNANTSAEDILNAVYKVLNQFTKGVKQEDDITLVVIKVNKKF